MTYKSSPNNFPPYDPPGSEEEVLDVKALLFSILRQWPWVLLCAIAALLLGRTYLRYTTPIYESRTTILIKEDANGSGALSEEVVLQELGIVRPKGNIANEVQYLKSRALMTEVMDNLGLYVRYIGEGRIKNTELYRDSPVLVDSLRWGGEHDKAYLQVEVLDPLRFRYFLEGEEEEEGREHRFSRPLVLDRDTFWLSYNPDNAGEDLRLHLKIGISPKKYLSELKISTVEDYASVLSLEIEDPVAQKAADLLNMLVEVYNSVAIDDKQQVAQKTLEFIDERLRLLTQELSTVEGGLESYKERNRIPTETTGTIDIILNEISTYDNAMTQQQIKLELLGTIEDMLERNVEQFELIPANLVLEDAIGLNEQIVQYNQLISTRERLQRSAAVDNPQLIEINQQLGKLRGNIVSSIELYKRSVRLTNEETRQKINQLQQRVNQVPRQERELLEIKRQQNIKEALYLYLLQKKEEMALSAAVVVPNARVIDAAQPSSKPIAPEPRRVYAISLLLGLFLPMGIIFLRELLDTNVYSEDDIERLTDIPLLGVVPEKRGKESIVVNSTSRSAIAERFRLLRTNLAYLSPGKKRQTILFTSGAGGDGKTFIAINLAMSLALNGKKTVIIGMDLRKPKTIQYLGVNIDPQTEGIANFLVDDVEPAEIVYPSGVQENLYHIPSGPVPPNPAELLSMRGRLEQLFTYLRAEFDYILIDTAPVGLVTDALLLQSYTDVNLFVVRHGKTPRETVKRVEKMYRDGKLDNPAIILNGFKVGKGYGYYDKGYGYYQESNKRKWLPRLLSKA